jgi:hypothetical protein
MLRITHFLDNRLTDCQPFTPVVGFMNVHGTHFCWRLIDPKGSSGAGRFRYIEKSTDLIRI